MNTRLPRTGFCDRQCQMHKGGGGLMIGRHGKAWQDQVGKCMERKGAAEQGRNGMERPGK